MVNESWGLAEARCPEAGYSLDCWHGCTVLLRTKLKGWNIRSLGEQKKVKRGFMDELSDIDRIANMRELTPEEWSHRYEVERRLEQIYHEEEIYWRQRMGKHWLMAGDSNTKNFHQFANGRRKSTIIQLETEQGLITE